MDLKRISGVSFGSFRKTLHRHQSCLPFTPMKPRPVITMLSSREDAAESASSLCGAIKPQYDASLPFLTATQRLRELLETASWQSEDEMLRHEVASLLPEMKLTLFTNLGSVLTLAAFVTSWLTGEDPLGGFAMTDDSLGATAAGAAYALPLVLCSVLSRLQPVRHSFPVLDDLHDSQQEIVQPIVQDLNPSQLLILSIVLVVPCMLVLLPACHGAARVATHILLDADLMQSLSPALSLQLPVHLPHLHLPGMWGRSAGVLVPAVGSAFLAAWIVTRQLDVNPHQVAAIREALESADRYFLHAAAERAAESPELLGESTAVLTSSVRQQEPQTASSWAAAGVEEVREDGPTTSFASVAGVAEYGSGVGVGAALEGSGPLRQLGAEMAAAFKTVSILWLLTRRRAARLGFLLTALNVSYFGIIWHHTHDLGTPVAAALLATLTELFLINNFPRGKDSRFEP